MDNYSGLLPFLWKTFKTKPQERKMTPEMQPLSVPHMIQEDKEDIYMTHPNDDEYFLHPEVVGKSPARFPKSPGMFGRSPGRSPGRSHRRRNSTGLSGFSLPKMLSSKIPKSSMMA